MLILRARKYKKLADGMMTYLEEAYGLPKRFTRPAVKSQIRHFLRLNDDTYVFHYNAPYWAEDLIDWYISVGLGRLFGPWSEETSFEYQRHRKEWLKDALRRAQAGETLEEVF